MFGLLGLDQFTRAAAAVFRSHQSDAGAKANGAAEAWDVDLEAASWRCHAPDLADVDLEVGEQWRGRPVLNDAGSSLRSSRAGSGVRHCHKARAGAPRPKSLVRVRPQHGDFEAPKMPVKTPACSTRSSSRSRPGAPPAVPAAAASSDAAEAPQAAEKAAEPEATPEEAALEPQEEGSERVEGPAMEKTGAAEPSASALEAPNPEAHTAEESDVGEEAAPAQALAETLVAGELVQEVAEASELLDPPGITSGTYGGSSETFEEPEPQEEGQSGNALVGDLAKPCDNQAPQSPGPEAQTITEPEATGPAIPPHFPRFLPRKDAGYPDQDPAVVLPAPTDEEKTPIKVPPLDVKPPSGKPGLLRRPNLEKVSSKPFPKAPPPGPPPATPAAAAPVAAASKGVAGKAQPKQVQFQGPERPAMVTEATVQPVVDSITRSSPSPAKAKAAHSTGVKAVARVTFKGADAQSDAKGAVEGGEDVTAAPSGASSSANESRSQEIVVRPRNQEKLGLLQCKGSPGEVVLRAWKESSIQLLPKLWSFSLPESGLDPKVVSAWLQGHISWGFCLVHLVDGLLRKGSTERGWKTTDVANDSRNMPEVTVEQLNSQGRQALVDHLMLNAKPWLLGTLAGGLVSLPGFEKRELAEFLPAPKVSPEQAVEDAFHWFCQGFPDQEQSALLVQSHQSLVLAISYRRLQLKAHPVVSSSNAAKMVQAAVKMETLRAAASKDMLYGQEKAESHFTKRSELSDWDLWRLMGLMQSCMEQSSELRNLLEAAGFLEQDTKERLMRYMVSLDKSRNDSRVLKEKYALEAQRILMELPTMPETMEELSKAYKKMAFKLHPDRHQENADEYKEPFQQMHDAYVKLLEHVAGCLPTESASATRKITKLHLGLPSKLPQELWDLTDNLLNSAQLALMLRHLANPPECRPLGRAASGPAMRSRSGKRKPKPGQNAQAESDLGKDDKSGGAEESEDGSDGSEDFPGGEQPDDPQLSDGHQSDGSQRSDDSGALWMDSQSLTRGPWRSSSCQGRKGLIFHYAGAVMEAGAKAYALADKICPWVKETKPFFASFLCQFKGQSTPGASDLLLHQHSVLDQLEAGYMWSVAARKLGLHSKTQASECSDNSCLWEPRSKKGRTDGQALAQDAGVAALSFAASFMACEEAYQEAQRFGVTYTRFVQTKEKYNSPDGVDGQDKASSETTGREKDYVGAAILIWEYNREMIAHQLKLRDDVQRYPFLLDPVTQPEKEAVFGVVSEVLQIIGHQLEQLALEESIEEMEATLSPIFVATAWHWIASPPSIEARLLRLAALIDVATLKLMLKDFFALNLNTLGDRGLPMGCRVQLSKKWDDAMQRLEEFQCPASQVVELDEWPDQTGYDDGDESAGEILQDLFATLLTH